MKKYSTKFWITFFLGSVIFLFGWFVFWEVKNHRLGGLDRLLGFIPLTQETRMDLETVIFLADELLYSGGQEKTFLILFQNNMELRPGGGFIGSFGILKIQNGNIVNFAVHDTGNFDGRIPSTVEPPYPMRETMKIDSWKLRDSNYAPDFPENAKWAETFYQMGQGEERFDGVVAVTANVLTSFLKVTGPVTIEGFPGTYGADNAVLDLEYQVEHGYREQNITPGERKSMMGVLGMEILHRAKDLSLVKKYELFRTVLADLHKKDVQLLFKDSTIQERIIAAGWDGAMDTGWKDDYLFLTDANLGSFKTDYFIKRSYAYTVDLTQEVPQATLVITYRNTAEKRDWFAKDYQTFLRAYVPTGSFLNTVTGAAKDPVFGEFLGRKYFGVLVQVPIRTEKTVTFEYALPKNLAREWYDLKIQKQPGLSDVPVTLIIIRQDGSREEKSLTMNRDVILSEMK